MKLVLTIIGMTLLIFFLIILALILLILFCPMVYKVKGSFGNSEQRLHGKIIWLLGFVGITFVFEEETKAYARILFFKKYLYSSKISEEKYEEVLVEDDNEQESSVFDSKEMLGDSCDAAETVKNEEESRSSDINRDTDSNTDSNTAMALNDTQEATATEDSLDEKNYIEQLVDRIKALFEKVKQTFVKIKEKKDNITDSISNISDKYNELTKNSSNRAAISHLKDEIIYLIEKIKPRKLKLRLKFSTGSPDSTGIVLGTLAMFPIGYRNRWNIEGDFESDEFYINGDTDIKGYIFGYQLIGIALRLVFDKNCRKLYNSFNK